jgi:hypothetical protein
VNDTYLPFPRQTRRRRSFGPVRIEVGARSCWAYGPGLAGLLDEIGSPRMWCPFKKALTFPVDRCDDLLALLEHRDGRAVELTAVDR